jgi:hypothetical protein
MTNALGSTNIGRRISRFHTEELDAASCALAVISQTGRRLTELPVEADQKRLVVCCGR